MINKELISGGGSKFAVNSFFTISGYNLNGLEIIARCPEKNGIGPILSPVMLVSVNESFPGDTVNKTYEQHYTQEWLEDTNDILRGLYNITQVFYLDCAIGTTNVIVQSFNIRIKAWGIFSGGVVNPESPDIPFRVYNVDKNYYTCAGDDYADFMQSINFSAERWDIYFSLYLDIN